MTSTDAGSKAARAVTVDESDARTRDVDDLPTSETVDDLGPVVITRDRVERRELQKWAERLDFRQVAAMQHVGWRLLRDAFDRAW